MYGHFNGEDENLLELGVACLREPHFCSFGNLSDSSDILTNSTKNHQLSYTTSMLYDFAAACQCEVHSFITCDTGEVVPGIPRSKWLLHSAQQDLNSTAKLTKLGFNRFDLRVSSKRFFLLGNIHPQCYGKNVDYLEDHPT
jgi:hypothetical protein